MKKIIKLGSLIIAVSLMSMSLEAKNLPSKIKGKKMSVMNVHKKNNKVVDLENCNFDACGHIVSCVVCDITVKAKPAPLCSLQTSQN